MHSNGNFCTLYVGIHHASCHCIVAWWAWLVTGISARTEEIKKSIEKTLSQFFKYLAQCSTTTIQIVLPPLKPISHGVPSYFVLDITYISTWKDTSSPYKFIEWHCSMSWIVYQSLWQRGKIAIENATTVRIPAPEHAVLLGGVTRLVWKII